MFEPFIKFDSIEYVKPDQSMFFLHTHDLYEILYFISGDASYCIEGNMYTLSPGDIFLMKNGEAHNLLIRKDIPYNRIVINFNEEAILSVCSKDILGFLNRKPFGKNNRYPNHIFKEEKWFKYINKIITSHEIAQQRLYLTVLLNELCLNAAYIYNDDVIEDTINNIATYINNHLKDELSIDFLCDKFKISQTHLNRKFKSMLGTTVKQYILNKRLVMANSLIKNGVPPTSVYLDCGFNDYSTFYRAYKKLYNSSPKNHK